MPRITFAALAAAAPLVLAAPAVGQETAISETVVSQNAPSGVSYRTIPATGETFLYGAGLGLPPAGGAGGVAALVSPDGSKVWGYDSAGGELVPLPVDIPEEERGKVAPVLGAGVMMLKAGGKAYAFGGGNWAEQDLGDRTDAPPIVSKSVGAIKVEAGVYAFSGVTGSGELYELGEDEKDAQPSVTDGAVIVKSKTGFAVFGAAGGTWASVAYPDPPAGEDPADEPPAATEESAVDEPPAEGATADTPEAPVTGDDRDDAPAKAEPAPAPPEDA